MAIFSLAYICDCIRNNSIILAKIFEAKLTLNRSTPGSLTRKCLNLFLKEIQLTFFGMQKISFTTFISLLIISLSNYKNIQTVYDFLKPYFDFDTNSNYNITNYNNTNSSNHV